MLYEVITMSGVIEHTISDLENYWSLKIRYLVDATKKLLVLIDNSHARDLECRIFGKNCTFVHQNCKAMKKRIEDLLVIENKRLNEEFYTLTLQSKQGLPEIAPGQFAEVRIDGEPGVFLRRPISIYQVHPETNTLELLIKIAGKGTSHLAHIQAGSNLSLVYPLGNRFTDPKGPKVLLVGGGTGVAPMLILRNNFV